MEDMEINLARTNILVTGGTGFIGSHLVEKLVGLGANIVVTYRTLDPLSYFSTKKLAKSAVMFNTDICDFGKIYDIVTRFEIDYIFHLAAQSLVETAFYNPTKTLHTNIHGTINILESARLFPKVKGVFVASSDKAYGKLGIKKYQETDPLRGDHPYEVSKSSADLIAQSYYKTYCVPVVITRLGNVYGEGDQNFSRVIPGIMKSIIKNEQLQIRSDGKYSRDYLYIKDAIDGYLLLAKNIEKIKGEVFNLSSNENMSVVDLINLIEKKLNKKINYVILNTTKNEILYQSLDFSKMSRILNWNPKWNLRKTINKVYDYYKQIL